MVIQGWGQRNRRLEGLYGSIGHFSLEGHRRR